MKTREFIEKIRLYFNEEKTYKICNDFYLFLESVNIEDLDDYYELNYFWGELADIYEQAEPWNDVKHFKPLDNQLRELLKKYDL